MAEPTIPQDTSTLQNFIANTASTLPGGMNHPIIPQMQALLAQGGDPNSLLAQMQQMQQQALGNDAAVPQATVTDTLAKTGDIVKELLGAHKFTATDPSSGESVVHHFITNDAAAADAKPTDVNIRNVTVDTEMSGGSDSKQLLVFKFHVDHGDTVYLDKIAQEAKEVLAALHPAFKPVEGEASPVSAVSYRDDKSISVAAELPAGKSASDIISEIIQSRNNVEKATTEPATTEQASVVKFTDKFPGRDEKVIKIAEKGGPISIAQSA